METVDVVVNYTESKWTESSRGLLNIRWNHLKNVAIVAVNNDEERSSCKGKNVTGVEKVVAWFTKYSIAYSPQNLKCKNNFTEGHPKNMIQMVFYVLSNIDYANKENVASREPTTVTTHLENVLIPTTTQECHFLGAQPRAIELHWPVLVQGCCQMYSLLPRHYHTPQSHHVALSPFVVP
jgi:hypothetical protein